MIVRIFMTNLGIPLRARWYVLLLIKCKFAHIWTDTLCLSTCLKTYGDHAFLSVAPHFWISLPAILHSTDDLEKFTADLKRYIFLFSSKYVNIYDDYLRSQVPLNVNVTDN